MDEKGKKPGLVYTVLHPFGFSLNNVKLTILCTEVTPVSLQRPPSATNKLLLWCIDATV